MAETKSQGQGTAAPPRLPLPRSRSLGSMLGPREEVAWLLGEAEAQVRQGRRAHGPFRHHPYPCPAFLSKIKRVRRTDGTHSRPLSADWLPLPGRQAGPGQRSQGSPQVMWEALLPVLRDRLMGRGGHPRRDLGGRYRATMQTANLINKNQNGPNPQKVSVWKGSRQRHPSHS